jgi:hypothetical protein
MPVDAGMDSRPPTKLTLFRLAMEVILALTGRLRLIYLAFFVGLGLLVLLLPSARSNAQSAGFSYTWTLITVISVSAVAVICLPIVVSGISALLSTRGSKKGQRPED